MYHFHFKYNVWSGFWITVPHRLQLPLFATSPKFLDISCCIMLNILQVSHCCPFYTQISCSPSISALSAGAATYLLLYDYCISAPSHSKFYPAVTPTSTTIRQPGIPTDLANLIDLFISSSELMRAWTYCLTAIESWQRCTRGYFSHFLFLIFPHPVWGTNNTNSPQSIYLYAGSILINSPLLQNQALKEFLLMSVIPSCKA